MTGFALRCALSVSLNAANLVAQRGLRFSGLIRSKQAPRRQPAAKRKAPRKEGLEWQACLNSYMTLRLLEAQSEVSDEHAAL